MMQQIDRKRQMMEEKINLLRTGELLTKLIASEEYKWIDSYLAHRQAVLVNELTTPATGGDGMGIALRGENNKGALQEIRLFIQTVKTILEQYQQVRKTAEVPNEEVPQTAQPPKSEADMPTAAPVLEPQIKENSDA